MPERADADAWLRFAQQDLAAARVLLTEAELPARLSCFHAQQAAEKAMKAHLVRLGIAFRRTHDLVVLAALLPDDVQRQLERVDLQVLQQWAVEARYPAELPESSKDDAIAALTVASLVVDVVVAARSPDEKP
ncbi:MAG: HEPN domain-containing protein [Acidimicrobiales bacterium]